MNRRAAPKVHSIAARRAEVTRLARRADPMLVAPQHVPRRVDYE